MFETICTQIIRELGPTGLLVVGLYFFLALPLKKIAHHIAIINGEAGQIRDELKEISRSLDKRN